MGPMFSVKTLDVPISVFIDFPLLLMIGSVGSVNFLQLPEDFVLLTKAIATAEANGVGPATLYTAQKVPRALNVGHPYRLIDVCPRYNMGYGILQLQQTWGKPGRSTTLKRPTRGVAPGVNLGSLRAEHVDVAVSRAAGTPVNRVPGGPWFLVPGSWFLSWWNSWFLVLGSCLTSEFLVLGSLSLAVLGSCLGGRGIQKIKPDQKK